MLVHNRSPTCHGGSTLPLALPLPSGGTSSKIATNENALSQVLALCNGGPFKMKEDKHQTHQSKHLPPIGFFELTHRPPTLEDGLRVGSWVRLRGSIAAVTAIRSPHCIAIRFLHGGEVGISMPSVSTASVRLVVSDPASMGYTPADLTVHPGAEAWYPRGQYPVVVIARVDHVNPNESDTALARVPFNQRWRLERQSARLKRTNEHSLLVRRALPSLCSCPLAPSPASNWREQVLLEKVKSTTLIPIQFADSPAIQARLIDRYMEPALPHLRRHIAVDALVGIVMDYIRAPSPRKRKAVHEVVHEAC